MSYPNLEINKEYSNEDIVEIFKCGNQGGMRRSLKTNSLIIISDHTKPYYEDVWRDGILYYTGMGKTGDQDLQFAQNKTLAESESNGVKVYLFEVFEKGKYIYRGPVKLIGKPYPSIQVDFKGIKRKVWIFPVKIIDSSSTSIYSENVFIEKQKKLEEKVKKLSDQELRKGMVPDRVPPTQEVIAKRFIYDPRVGEYVKRRANGRCNLCGQTAPFIDNDGSPYLEVHHIKWLSRGGLDSITNAVALCPNCHRKMHILDKKEDVDFLVQYVKKSERHMLY